MPVYKGTNSITSVYKGDTSVGKIYKGTTLVFQKETGSGIYIVTTSGTITQYLINGSVIPTEGVISQV